MMRPEKKAKARGGKAVDPSQEKLAQSLRDVEDRYRALVENSPDAIVVHRNGQFLFMNEAGLRLHGVKSLKELRGKTAFDFIHPDDQAAVLKKMEEAATGNPAQVTNVRVLRPDGSMSYVEAVEIPTVFDGQPASQAVIRDVTERMRMESTLRINQSLIGTVTKNSPIVLATLDRNLRYTWLSSARHGFKSEDVIGKRPDELIPPAHASDLIALLEEVLRTEAGNRRLISGMTGKRQWIYDATVEPLRDERGKVTGLSLALIDISDREFFKKAYQTSETRYRDLMEGAPDAVIVHRDGKFLYANPAALKLYRGHSLEDLQRFELIDLVFPDDREAARKRKAQAAGGTKTPLLEERLVVLDGSTVFVEATSWPIDFEGGPAIQTILRDVTARKKAEQALQRSQSLLAQAEKVGRVGGWEFDIDTKRQTWTETTYEIHEVDLSYQPTVEKGVQFYTPASRPLIEQAVQRAIAQGEPFDLELEIITAKGNLRHVHAIGRADLPRRKVFGFFQDISERKKIELALRESERRFHSLAESAPVGIFRTDARGKAIYANPKMCELYGLDSSSALGDDWTRAIHPDDREWALRDWMKAVSEGRESRAEYRYLKPDGETVWVMGEATPEHDESGNLIGYVGTVFDITRMKQIEAELRQSEERFRKIFEEGPTGVALVTLDATIIRANRQFCDMLGYAKNEMVGVNIQGFSHPEDWALDVAHAQRLFRGEVSSYSIDKRYLHKDGHNIWGRLTVSLMRDDKGQPISVIGMVEDITERKQTEEALRQSEALVRAAFDNVPFGFWARDLNGVCILQNEKTVKDWGSILGQSLEDSKVDAHTLAIWRNNCSRALAGEIISEEVELHSKHGTRFYHNVIVPFRVGHELRGILGFNIDITDRRRMENELRQSRQMAHALLNASTEGILLIEPEGKILALNAAMAARLGGNEGELIGRNIFNILPPDVAANRKKFADEVVRTGSPARFEDQRDGAFLDNHIYPVVDPDGKVSAVAVFTLDITERKRALDSLSHVLETERLFARQLGALHEITTELQRAGTVDELCRKAVELGREKLGFERTGLWFCDGPDSVVGTYGTDESGHTRDERNRRLPILPQSAVSRLISGRLRSELNTDVDLFDDQRRLIGHGTRLVGAIWSGDKIKGVLFADNLLHHKPLTEQHRRIIELYAGRLGMLVERLTAENALRENTELFSLFMRHSPIYAFIKDVSPTGSRVLQASENYKDMIGISGSEMVGKTMEDLFPADMAAKFTADDWDVVSSGKILKIDEDFNGRHYNTIKFPIVQGGRTLLAGYTIDITERVQAGIAMRKSEARYRLLHESMMDAFVAVALDGRITDSNPAYQNMLGYTTDELTHLTYTDLTPERWHDMERRIVNEQILPQGYSQVYEKEYRRRDGTIFPVELRTFLIRDDNGKPTGMWALVRDITERKFMEETLREREAHARSIVSTAMDAFWMVNKDGQIIDINDATCQMLGYRRDELIGMSIPALEANETAEQTAAHMKRIIARGEDRFETKNRRKDGSVVDIELSVTWNPTRQAFYVFARDITGRKQAEAALRQSEERFRMVLENSVDIAYRWNLKDDRYEYLSPIMEKVSGYAPEELSGAGLQKIVALIHEEDRPAVEKEVAALGSGQKNLVSCEYRFKCKDGRYKWFADQFRGTRDETGRLVNITGVVRDVTRRKQAEMALRQSEARFRALAEAVPQLIWMSDNRGRPEYANPQCIEYTGVSLAEAQKEGGWWCCIHPDDVVDVAEAAILAREKGQPFQSEYRMARAEDSQYRWFLERAVPIRDEQGRAIKWFATATDIHDKKMAEETLRRSHDELDRMVHERTAELTTLAAKLVISERNFRSLIENMKDIVYNTSPDGILTYVSPSVANYGLRPEEMLGKRFTEFIHPEDRDRVMRDFTLTVASGEERPSVFRAVTPKGVEFWFEDHGSPLADTGGKIIGIAGVLIDVTERVHAHEKLVAYQRQLRALLSDLTVAEEGERRRIAAGIHDDVGQLLIAAKIKLEQIARSSNPSEIRVLQAEADRHLDRVMTVLRSLTFELVSPVLQRLGFTAAIEQLCENMRTQYGIAIHLDDDKLPKPLAGETEIILYHAVRELLRNVIRHAGALNIRMDFTCADGFARILVEDDGKGFDTGRVRAGFGATGGFGLFTIRERMKHLGGTFDISSIAPHGTRIILTAPLAGKDTP